MTGQKGALYRFGPFRLDATERRLLREGRPVPLRAKLFDTLLALVQQHGRLVPKDDLLRAVWRDCIVEENNLAHNISVLRRTLGEPATGQQYIETVPGMGYRFVAEVEEAHHGLPAAAPAVRLETQRVGHLISRAEKRLVLRAAFKRALAGSRQVVFVTGEAGLGKTFLINAFVDEARGVTPLWCGQGQCLDHRGEGEPYMPLLEALARMCREPGGNDLLPFFARCAPTWLVQMPWLLTPSELETARRTAEGATRERMLREIVEAVDLLAGGKPLLLVLEDLHWSDQSTVEFISCFARRRGASRVLLAGTFRPGDGKGGIHAAQALARELEVRGLCQELALEFLNESAISEYLVARFEGSAAVADLAPMLYQRTEGNPLFLVNVVDHWVSRGLITDQRLAGAEPFPIEELSSAVPDTLRQLIEQQFAALDQEDRRILEAGSISGRIFAGAAIAAALGEAEEAIEERCDRLARHARFLDPCGPVEWSDGTLSALFSFRHDLHREVLYDLVPPARAARLHRRLGERLETAYGGYGREFAAELALHFTRGRDPERAVLYLRYAAEQALARSAHHEALEHLRSGLRILESSREIPDAAEHEAWLQNLLGRALIATSGWGSPEAYEAYSRAHAICQALGDPPEIASNVWLGLATLLEVRGQYKEAEALMERRLRAFPGDGAAPLLFETHELLACSFFHQGRFENALDQADRGLTQFDPEQRYSLLSCYGDDPAVSCHSWAALSLWFLGFADQALERAQQAVAHARNHSYSLANAQTQAAILCQLRREPAAAREWAERAVQVAEQHGFPYRVSAAAILRGWALAMSGDHVEGVPAIRAGLARCRDTGAAVDYPYHLTLLAEAYAVAGQTERALEALEEASIALRDTRSFFYEAEIHRLRGALLLQRSGYNREEAEKCFRQALQIAREQGAVYLELRTAVALIHLLGTRGAPSEWMPLLRDRLARLTEGLTTPDVEQARAIVARSEQGRSHRSAGV